MCGLEALKIDLKGLKEDEKSLRFGLGDDYFEAIDAPEVRRGNIDVALTIRKSAASFELRFHTTGTVHVACDLCLDDMEQDIETENRFVVKFGDAYAEDDDLITIDENEGILDVAWLIYEFVVLSIPIKHVHAPGKCNAAMTKKLSELSATRSSDEVDEEPTDPRWSKLKELKDFKN